MQFYIETERLIMRDIRHEDAPGIFELDSDSDVHKYLGRRPLVTIDEVPSMIDNFRRQYAENGIARWAVIEKATGDFVGWSGLKLMKEPVNGHVNYYDLGYRFIKRAWGKGYATETAISTLRYGWGELGLKEINGFLDIGNSGSINVFRKVGMQFINNFVYEGDDHAWYAILRPDPL